MALSNAILATPSTLVVPLSAIIDRLQGKLSAADLNALLLSVTGTVKSQVQPGDLISAELMNEVLAAISDLQLRVGHLESIGTTAQTLRILRIDGALPIRVGNRVTAVGEDFSVPASRNSVSVNATSVTPVDNASTTTALVFDMPDPGIGQGGRQVTLHLTNAIGQTASFNFQLEPALSAPRGDLSVSYITAPTGGATLSEGSYDFVYRLIANVDQNASVLISATASSTGWATSLIDPLGVTDFTRPITLPRSQGTHFERDFVLRVVAPSAGASAFAVTAREISGGSGVQPAPIQVLSLAIGQRIPGPESRLAVSFLSTSSNVDFDGGTAVFRRATLGRVDLDLEFSGLGTAAGASTVFTPTFSLQSRDTNAWQLGLQTGTQVSISGPAGNAATGLRITPPNAASTADLQLTVAGQPTGGAALGVTYRIPLRTN